METCGPCMCLVWLAEGRWEAAVCAMEPGGGEHCVRGEELPHGALCVPGPCV